MTRIEELQKLLESEWERIVSRHRPQPDGTYVAGKEILQEHTKLADLLLRRIYRSSTKDNILAEDASVAMVAVGGYGREELNPNSDIDLMILHDPSGCPHDALEGFVKRVVRDVWDLGYDLGSVVRTIADCKQLLSEDLDSLTAMLESRLVAGDQNLFQRFEREIKTREMRKGGNRFFQSQVEEWRRALADPGRILYEQQPNIKDGVGGLRDAHIIRWTARVRFGVWEIPALAERGIFPKSVVDDYEAGLDFLWRVRNALHYIVGRRKKGRQKDLLSFQHQEQVAKALGYKDIVGDKDIVRQLAEEELMQEYFRHARWIHECARMVINESRKESSWPWLRRRMDRAASKPLTEGLILLRDRIRFEENALTDDFLNKNNKTAARMVMDMFYLRAELDCHISIQSRKQIVETLHSVGPKFSTCRQAQNRFLELLALPNGVGDALRDMHHLGVLTAMVPEFEDLRYLVRRDHYHKYTTDEHTLAAVSNIDEKQIETACDSGALKAVLDDLSEEERVSLRLALLIHDIGKGAPGDKDHVERGLPLAQRIVNRFQIKTIEKQRGNIMFLVKNHHLKSNVAQQRNLDDPEVIQRYADEVGTMKRARKLYLVTYGDIRAVDPELWNGWRASLLHKLYAKTELVMRGDALVAPGQLNAMAEEAAARLGSEWEERVHEHFRLMIGARMPSYSIQEIAEQVQAADQFTGDAPCALRVFSESDDHTTAVFAAKDRIGMFTHLAGALAALNLNVLHADLNARSDGIAIDTLRFSNPIEELSVEKIVDAFDKAQRGEMDIDATLEAARQRDPRAYRTAYMPSEATCNNDDSTDFTIIDVRATERKGLLYTIAKTLSDANLNIHLAKISIEAYRSVSVFYVTDENGAKVRDKNRLEETVEALHNALQTDG